MDSSQAGEQRDRTWLVVRGPRAHAILVAVLLVVGFAVRLYRISDPPLRFHPYRQYRSALIARAYYFRMMKSVPEWRRAIADENAARQGLWEPPVMERFAALCYVLAGGERLAIPRILSCLFRVVGGLFLYRIARRGTSAGAALLSLGCYLFMPFGIRVSRAFMPEPLMLMLTLWALDGIMRYVDWPSTRRLLVGAGAAALALLVKPICVFAIMFAFGCASLARPGARRFAIRPGQIAFVTIAVVPAALYYGYALFVSGALSGMAGQKILPDLLVQVSFWSGWTAVVQQVVGFPALLGALIGVLLIRDALFRGLVVGLWLGYAVFGLVFSYTVHTHDYWSVQLLPIVALSLAPLFQVVLQALAGMPARWPRRALYAALGVLALALGAGQELWSLSDGSPARRAAIARHIGEIVGHSRRTAFLSTGYGLWLLYHGEISGVAWPEAADFRSERLHGRPQQSTAERFERLIASDAPDYFIVTDMTEFGAQPELRALLTSRYPTLTQTDDYVIFDLRRPAGQD